MDKKNMQSAASACPTAGGARQAVCIDAQRVYDSCSSKEYMEDLRVFFPVGNNGIIEQATNVRIKDVNVINIFLHLEAVPFNQGFYAVDMNLFFDVCLDVFTPQTICPTVMRGIAAANKRVILFGSDGNVKTFISGRGPSPDVELCTGKVLPKAVCQVSEPIGLSAKICGRPPQGSDICGKIPDNICKNYGAELDYECCRSIYVTIGMFTITQLVRTVPMLIPSYDFCIPDKECQPASDSPREMFRRIEFPAEDFFPPEVSEAQGTNNKTND